MGNESKLGLGGHSFIEELGNDPYASFEEQCSIVGECLDNGIALIDTTYYQERVALGHVLKRLGRRDEAKIMAWNFFKQPGREHELVGYTPYEPQHLDLMLEELQTDAIDLLVIHAHDDTVKLRTELILAQEWVHTGKVKRVALGMAQIEHLRQLPAVHPISAILTPYNAFHPDAKELFEMARSLGMDAIALSPFVRGWKLDEIGADKDAAAAILLRWVAAEPLVNHVVVSMRKAEWVHANLRAVGAGPLTEAEDAQLREWLAR